jgi:hypothetical protein
LLLPRGEDLVALLGPREWRVRGLAQNTSMGALKVNLRLRLEGVGFHLDVLDVYSARARQAFIQAATAELGLEPETVRGDLARLLPELEAHLERHVAAAKAGSGSAAPAVPPMTAAEREAALEFLRDPRLLERIVADARLTGLVGEADNVLVGYVAAVSRKLDDPLALIIQSSSAAGKSSLMDAILAFIPPEDKVQYSAMTGQSLFYMGHAELRHKTLAIAETEGAERATYALKLLQSEKRLSIASAGKDPKTGRQITHDYHTEGPTQVMLSTTRAELDEELHNRCLILTVDEGPEQTRAIHERQRAAHTLDGLLAARARAAVLDRHHHAQRLIEPLAVVNPYAAQLRFPDHRLRSRRDHSKYLNLIRAVTLLFQHQRPVRELTRHGQTVRYVEATPADIAVANRLAAHVMGASLDELAPQTRALLRQLAALAERLAAAEKIEPGQVRLTRRQIREHTGLGNSRLGIHLDRLVDLEYLLAHPAGGRRVLYELRWHGEGEDGSRFILALTDPATLQPPAAAASPEIPPTNPEMPDPGPALATTRLESVRPLTPCVRTPEADVRPIYAPYTPHVRSGENDTTGASQASCAEKPEKRPKKV